MQKLIIILGGEGGKGGRGGGGGGGGKEEGWGGGGREGGGEGGGVCIQMKTTWHTVELAESELGISFLIWMSFSRVTKLLSGWLSSQAKRRLQSVCKLHTTLRKCILGGDTPHCSLHSTIVAGLVTPANQFVQGFWKWVVSLVCTKQTLCLTPLPFPKANLKNTAALLASDPAVQNTECMNVKTLSV